MIQIVLLARTAAAYNDAVDHYVKFATDNARVRQRLANTLFAQLFAGSSREREGVLGWLLQIMAWATLSVAPLAILLASEFKFLPYHSHWTTWGHRILITLELTICFFFWASLRQFSGKMLLDYITRRWLVSLNLLFLTIAFVLFYGTVLSFPGERHASWTRWAAKSNDPNRSIFISCSDLSIIATLYSSSFDRLSLPREDFVDDEKLAKIENASREKRIEPYSGERTRAFRHRDLRCGDFEGADLRRVDFTDADLRGARFAEAELQGTTFERANLQYATLSSARLQSTNFTRAQLQGSDMRSALLQSAFLYRTILQGVDLSYSSFQNATISESHLQGAALRGSSFQGTFIYGTQLQGADLFGSQLHGASVYESQLQAVDLSDTQLAGASIRNSQLRLARFNKTYVWRSGAVACDDAQVTDLRLDPVVIADGFDQRDALEGDTEAIEKFIERISTNIPRDEKADFQKSLRDKLISERGPDMLAAEANWRSCISTAVPKSQYEPMLANYLADIACWQNSNQEDISYGIYRNWMNDETLGHAFKRTLARRLLGLDGAVCPNAEDALGDEIVRSLRPIAGN